MSLAQNIEATKDVLIIGGVIAGGIVVFIAWEKIFGKNGWFNQFVEDPLKATDNLSRTVTQNGIVDKSKELVKKATGGLVDLDFKTIGTSGTPQDIYNRTKFIDDHKGMRTAITGGVALVGQVPVLGQFAVAGAGLVKGIDTKIRSSKDAQISIDALSETQVKRDLFLAKQKVEMNVAKLDGKEFNPSLMNDPLIYLTEEQKQKTFELSEHLLDKDRLHKISPSNRVKYKKILDIYHALKQLQMEGFFLPLSDQNVVHHKPLTFLNALQKIAEPHLLVVISKKIVKQTRRFLQARNLHV